MSSQKSNKQTSKQVRVEREKRTSCWKSHSPGIIFGWNMAYLYCTEAFPFCTTLFQVCINIVGSFKQGSISYSLLAQENLFLATAGNFLSHHLVVIPIVSSKLLLTATTLENECTVSWLFTTSPHGFFLSKLWLKEQWWIIWEQPCFNRCPILPDKSSIFQIFQITMWGHNWKEHYKKMQPDPFCKRQNNDCGRELGNMLLWGPVQTHREVDVKGRQRQ